MWTCKELKEKAKIAIKKNYWYCLGITIVAALLSADKIFPEFNIETRQFQYQFSLGEVIELDHAVIPLTFMVGLGLFIAGFIFTFFIANPVKVGKYRFFLENREYPSTFNALFYAFKQPDYMNIVKIMFKKWLFELLWMFVFIIPGIVKSYEYYMIPMILAQNPGIDSKDAFSLTAEMTYHQKLNIFVLQLSFILWYIAAAFTCGIVGIAIMPYVTATDIELYVTLRENVLDGDIFDESYFPIIEGGQC